MVLQNMDGVTMSIKTNRGNENRASEIRRTQGQDRCVLDQDSDELLGRSKEGGAGQSERNAGTVGQGKSESTTINREGGHTKKLASQLELLKEAFYEYVGAHRGRLEQRLDENKQFTQIFEERLAALEQEVLGSPQHHTEEE